MRARTAWAWPPLSAADRPGPAVRQARVEYLAEDRDAERVAELPERAQRAAAMPACCHGTADIAVEVSDAMASPAPIAH